MKENTGVTGGGGRRSVVVGEGGGGVVTDFVCLPHARTHTHIHLHFSQMRVHGTHISHTGTGREETGRGVWGCAEGWRGSSLLDGR